MTQLRTKQRGGFRRPIQLSLFIRDELMKGPRTGHDLYLAYKSAVQAIPDPEYKRKVENRVKKDAIYETKIRARALGNPYRRGDKILLDPLDLEIRYKKYLLDHPRFKKRRLINYNGFMHYIYLMRRLNLVTYTDQVQVAHLKAHPELDAPDIQEAKFLKLVPSNMGNSAWNDVWEALYPGARERSSDV